MSHASRARCVLSLVVLLSGNASAHDFWIEPSTFVASPGDTVELRLFVGDHFRGSPFARAPGHLRWFILRSDGRAVHVEGMDGADPAGRAVVEESGVSVLSYRSRPSFIDLTDFELVAHLRQEGLDAVAERIETTGRTVREAFSRNAKAVIRVGSGPTDGFDRRAHLRLELVPERDPFGLEPGEVLPIRLLYEGDPLSGAVVSALHKEGGGEPVVGRTDVEGRVQLRLSRTGVWMVKSLFVSPARSTDSVDYRSEWSSLTFEIPPGGVP